MPGQSEPAPGGAYEDSTGASAWWDTEIGEIAKWRAYALRARLSAIDGHSMLTWKESQNRSQNKERSEKGRFRSSLNSNGPYYVATSTVDQMPGRNHGKGGIIQGGIRQDYRRIGR